MILVLGIVVLLKPFIDQNEALLAGDHDWSPALDSKFLYSLLGVDSREVSPIENEDLIFESQVQTVVLQDETRAVAILADWHFHDKFSFS